METKIAKSQKQTRKMASLSVRLETHKKAQKILSIANKKDGGRKIKPDALLSLALDLISEDHIKSLQERSLTNDERKERLRKLYIEMHGHISADDFTGFMLTPEFATFLLEQSGQISG